MGMHTSTSSRVLWIPPRSPFQLLQEELFFDPWKLLIGTIFLQKTSYKTAGLFIYKFFQIYPDAKSVDDSSEAEIIEFVRPLGYHNTRAKKIKRLSKEYLTNDNWKKASEFYGIGKYGNDSYEIFCLGLW